jgi:hypothetical protein
VVEVQDGVEDQEVPRVWPRQTRLLEKRTMCPFDRHVHDRRVLGNLLPVFEETRDEQVLAVAVSQDDAGAL